MPLEPDLLMPIRSAEKNKAIQEKTSEIQIDAITFIGYEASEIDRAKACHQQFLESTGNALKIIIQKMWID